MLSFSSHSCRFLPSGGGRTSLAAAASSALATPIQPMKLEASALDIHQIGDAEAFAAAVATIVAALTVVVDTITTVSAATVATTVEDIEL